MKRVRSLHRQGKTNKAISMINSLIEKTRKISEQAISPWHEQQALGLKSIILQETGRIKDAADSERVLVGFNQLQVVYWGRALANSLAIAASLNFGAGRNSVAAKMAREAIQKANQFKETNSIIKDAKEKLKRYENERSRKKRTKHTQQRNRGDRD